MSSYHFIIDKDHVGTGQDGKRFGNVEDALEIPKLDGPTKFRLYDDDGELYYEGRQWDQGDEESAFAPLDWAMGYAGCTRMEIFENGVWKQL